MGKFLRTTVKRTQDAYQQKTQLLLDQADSLNKKIKYLHWNLLTHASKTLHYPDKHTHTHTDCSSLACVFTVKLQAVQGDPVLPRLPLHGR